MKILVYAFVFLGFVRANANPVQCFDYAIRTRNLSPSDALYLCGGANGLDPLLCFDIAKNRGLITEQATSLCRKGNVSKTIHCFDISANRELTIRDRLLLCRE